MLPNPVARLNSQWKLSLLAAGILASSAVALLVTTGSLPAGSGREPGPAAWPRLVLFLWLIAALYVIVDTLRNRDDRRLMDRDVLTSAIAMATTVAYLVTVPWLGYAPATALFLVTTMYLLGVRSPVVLVGVSLGLTGAVYVVFTSLINTRFPAGVLGI